MCGWDTVVIAGSISLALSEASTYLFLKWASLQLISYLLPASSVPRECSLFPFFLIFFVQGKHMDYYFYLIALIFWITSFPAYKNFCSFYSPFSDRYYKYANTTLHFYSTFHSYVLCGGGLRGHTWFAQALFLALCSVFRDHSWRSLGAHMWYQELSFCWSHKRQGCYIL